MTWANRHAKAGFVLAYCALQPLVAMLLTIVLVLALGASSELALPGYNALGAVGVAVGLAIILYEGKRQHDADTQPTQPLNARHMADVASTDPGAR